MDPDIWMVLTEEEQAEYLACSVRAAGQRSADLVPCPMPGCAGLAVASTGTWILMYCWREVQAVIIYLVYVFSVPGPEAQAVVGLQGCAATHKDLCPTKHKGRIMLRRCPVCNLPMTSGVGG